MTKKDTLESTAASNAIFSSVDRKHWQKQFVRNLRFVLYNPDTIYQALNFRGSITHNKNPLFNYKKEQIEQALLAIQDKNYSAYNVFSWPAINRTLQYSGLQPKEINALTDVAKIIYDAAIYYALAPMCTEHPDTNNNAIIKPSTPIDNPQEPEVEQAYQSLFKTLISNAGFEIRLHEKYMTSTQRLEASINNAHEYQALQAQAKKVLQATTQLVKANKEHLNIETLIQILDCSSDAISKPSIENAQRCVKLSQQMDERCFSKSLKNALICFAGLLMLSVSAALAITSFAPLLALSTISTVASTALLTAGSTALLYKGGMGFFQDIKKPLISKSLGDLSCAINTCLTD